MTDYKELCNELFGTTDIDELKSIATRIQKRKLLSNSDVEKIYEMQRNGYTTTEIAKHFGVSRQTVSKYINPPLIGNYSMRMYYMHKQDVCTMIDVDFLNKRVKAVNRTDNVLFRAFGTIEYPTWDDLIYFLKERCFSESRGDKKELLCELGIDNYDVFRIVEKTEGRCADDNQYVIIKYRGDAV